MFKKEKRIEIEKRDEYICIFAAQKLILNLIFIKQKKPTNYKPRKCAQRADNVVPLPVVLICYRV